MSVIAATHTVVKTGNTTRPFGAGLLRSTPFAGRMPYTYQDTLDAAAMFADDATGPEPDWDAMALEAEHQDRLDAMAPSTYGRCDLCSMPCDALEPNGLCPRYDVIAWEKSTTQRYR
ncbi:MAG: hypothetical protein ACLQGP_03215 [Isosphaeraceae bacterium]